MTEQQFELLTRIQCLALACRDLTGARTSHQVDSFPDGDTWSELRISGDDHRAIFDSVVSIRKDGSEGRAISTHTPNTLAEQRDALASWIVANRKEKAA